MVCGCLMMWWDVEGAIIRFCFRLTTNIMIMRMMMTTGRLRWLLFTRRYGNRQGPAAAEASSRYNVISHQQHVWSGAYHNRCTPSKSHQQQRFAANISPGDSVTRRFGRRLFRKHPQNCVYAPPLFAGWNWIKGQGAEQGYNRRFFVGKWGSLSFTNGQGIVNLSIFVGGKLIYYILLIDIR